MKKGRRCSLSAFTARSDSDKTSRARSQPSRFSSAAGELEDALEVALKAAGGVHEQLLDLGLSCEDLGKCSVHLAVAARDAPAEVKEKRAGRLLPRPFYGLRVKRCDAGYLALRGFRRVWMIPCLDPVPSSVTPDLQSKTARNLSYRRFRRSSKPSPCFYPALAPKEPDSDFEKYKSPCARINRRSWDLSVASYPYLLSTTPFCG